ncbi:succinoglycan biosynthesis [Halobacteriales archaeon QS_8_69_26]|nr:MAG: succinoglycan biosynthesis [Halobacteriales archaeon QS_8_69_26]
MTERDTGDPDTGSVAERLREYAEPLDGTDPSTAVDDLAFLDDALEDRRILGMGEATHGTREFFQLKHRLLRYLVLELDCRTFAWEANFSETLAIDRYVRRGEGDPVEAIDGVHFWTWDTEEVLAMVEWIRSFNEDRDPEDRVRFYGVDMQFSGGPARALREYLDEADPDFLADVEAGLRELEDEDLNGGDDESFERRREDVAALLSDLEDRFADRREAYEAATGPDEYRLARRHLRTLRQAFESRRAMADREEAGYALRDEYMAENASWVLDHEDADLVALWGHNAHVKTTPVRSDLDDDWEAFESTGGHLREEHGDDYYVVGFEFGRGSFQAIPDPEEVEEPELGEFSLDEPIEDTVPDVLDDVGYSTFFVDLASAAGDPDLADWLGEERRMHSLGAIYYVAGETGTHYTDVVLADEYDGLLFVDGTERAVPIEE